MRALVYDRYGGPDCLRMQDVPRPAPNRGEVLVRVEAVGLNGSDTEYLQGSPAYARLNGLTRPRKRILGSDIAGRVVECGEGVTDFAPGMAVFGDILSHLGGLAEYVAVPARLLVVRPPELDAIRAAALPQSGAIALQGLGDVVETGQRVLINGAGGAAGAWATRMAFARAAQVTAVDRASKVEGLRRLGAARVLDYAEVDFAAEAEAGPYDLILDLFGTRGPRAVARVLAPGGRYRIVGGTLKAVLACAAAGPLVGLATKRSIGLLALKQTQGTLRRLATYSPGPVIDSTWPLESAPEAFARLIDGQSLGKIVITLTD